MLVNLPTARQYDYGSILPRLIFLGLIILPFYVGGAKDFTVYGALTYFVISFDLKNFIPIDHRVAMRLINKRDFTTAIDYFNKSYAFFTRFSWIDRYRYLILLSSSKMCYREMALNNIGYCYSQLGNGEKAVEYFERTVREFPENEMAKAALNLINAVK